MGRPSIATMTPDATMDFAKVDNIELALNNRP